MLKEILIPVLLGLGGCLSLAIAVWGLIKISRAGSMKGMRLVKAMVRQVTHCGQTGSQVVLSMNVDEEIFRVDCQMPGKRLFGKGPQPASLVYVYWRKGESTAVAAASVLAGQAMMILGFAAFCALAVLFVLL